MRGRLVGHWAGASPRIFEWGGGDESSAVWPLANLPPISEMTPDSGRFTLESGGALLITLSLRRTRPSAPSPRFRRPCRREGWPGRTVDSALYRRTGRNTALRRTMGLELGPHRTHQRCSGPVRHRSQTGTGAALTGAVRTELHCCSLPVASHVASGSGDVLVAPRRRSCDQDKRPACRIQRCGVRPHHPAAGSE